MLEFLNILLFSFRMLSKLSHNILKELEEHFFHFILNKLNAVLFLYWKKNVYVYLKINIHDT